MSLLKLLQNNLKNAKICCNEKQVFITSNKLSTRKLHLIPSVYDGTDPGPKFFSSSVQLLLKRLARPDYKIIFRDRANAKFKTLPKPIYKYLTDDELNKEIKKAEEKANELLQMPPVVKLSEPINEVVSRDPGLHGFDDSTYIFTDITFGIENERRLIVQREYDGTLRKCNHDVRKRMNQIYFPIEGRNIREPKIFSEEECFNRVIEQNKYEYLLDRACIQYEPDELQYQRITSLTYQHIDKNSHYNLLRSTRHFGPMAFYLAWHNSMDNLLLEIIQSCLVREGVLLVALRQALLEDLKNEVDGAVVSEIIKSPIQFVKPDHITEVDLNLDSKCLEILEEYVGSKSTMKSQQELALQGFREYYRPLADRCKGLKLAHGLS